ncbi:hypothetical protein E2C01_075151 [Portunus trituberculatus]|uniref:Uncharacterized protein n=1 Tax=Portunus trituberculatus TaxID=210409 RepID=A0A5B7IFF2_PORTR|nr:hypothetical protein [Portunus trituberculatus]
MRKEQAPHQVHGVLHSTEIGDLECTRNTTGNTSDTTNAETSTRDTDLANTTEDANFNQLPSMARFP